MREEPLIDQVRARLTADEFIALVEVLGGTRIYLPRRLPDDHELVDVIGRDAAQRIVAPLARGEWLTVPLARRERALHYEAQGLKDHQIARKLGMTRSGVQKLLDREALRPRRPSRYDNPDQLKLL